MLQFHFLEILTCAQENIYNNVQAFFFWLILTRSCLFHWFLDSGREGGKEGEGGEEREKHWHETHWLVAFSHLPQLGVRDWTCNPGNMPLTRKSNQRPFGAPAKALTTEQRWPGQGIYFLITAKSWNYMPSIE